MKQEFEELAETLQNLLAVYCKVLPQGLMNYHKQCKKAGFDDKQSFCFCWQLATSLLPNMFNSNQQQQLDPGLIMPIYDRLVEGIS